MHMQIMVARNVNTLKGTFKELEREAQKVGLYADEENTKYMKVSSPEGRRRTEHLSVGWCTFQGLREFKYLGASINNENKISNEIANRIMSGNRVFYAHQKIFSFSLVSKRIELRLYKTLIRQVVTYAAEIWTLLSSDIHNLRVFEIRILRKVFGPVKESKEWRIRKNREFEE